MKRITVTATFLTALAIGFAGTISSGAVSRALAGPDDLAQPAVAQAEMPVLQMMAGASHLASQSFDAF
jgi:hypothetical protein